MRTMVMSDCTFGTTVMPLETMAISDWRMDTMVMSD